jgi:DNA-directed RNA polymerase specialized sigma24 family protein
VDGEAEGFAQFVEARQLALQRTAWLLTNDWALAQDLVQTALARSWPYWERIRRSDDPEIYVRRVMVNTWSTWRRRRWRAERPSLESWPTNPLRGFGGRGGHADGDQELAGCADGPAARGGRVAAV